MNIKKQLRTKRALVSYQELSLANAVCQTLSDINHGKNNPNFFIANNISQDDLEHDLILLNQTWEKTQIKN